MATTIKITPQLLDYVATQEEAFLTYSRIQMTLATNSDVRYLNKPEACSRAGIHFLLPNNTLFLPKNGSILTIAQIIKNAISSTVESELGALYIASQEESYIWIIIEKLEHNNLKLQSKLTT